MTLQWYFARRFLITFGLVALIVTGLIWMTDMVEQLRRYTNQHVGFSMAAGLAALNAPKNLYQVLPILTIIATVTLFLRMARTSELVITRAAGRSALRSLSAPVLVMAVLGVLAVTVFNPIVATTSLKYESITDRLRGGTGNVLSISAEGLWLRQAASSGQVVIHAKSSNDDGTVLGDVTFLGFGDGAQPSYRIEAATAKLSPGVWELTNAKRWALLSSEVPEADAVFFETYSLETDLTIDQIRDSFGPPSSVAFWDLPAFISRLERAGFAARQHRVWFHMELASPLFLVSMVLIGAGFTMRHTRFGKTGLMVLLAILMGFAMFFLKTFAQVLGDTGKIPVVLAAWSPPVAGVLLSLGLLLHTEDG